MAAASLGEGRPGGMLDQQEDAATPSLLAQEEGVAINQEEPVGKAKTMSTVESVFEMARKTSMGRFLRQEGSDGVFVNNSGDSANPARPPESIREMVWQIITNCSEANARMQVVSWFYQAFSAIYIVALILVDSTTEKHVTTRTYWYMELSITVVWSLEFLLRIWSCVEAMSDKHNPESRRRRQLLFRAQFCLRPMVFLDVLSLASLYIDLSIETNKLRGISSLRMLRLITLARIERDFRFMGPVVEVIQNRLALLTATLGIAGLVLLVSSVIMFYIEGPVNPHFDSVLQSMWWGTTALTTVGYGDSVPITGFGRFVASVVAFMGIGMFALPAGIIASGFAEQADRINRQSRLKLTRSLSWDALGCLEEEARRKLADGATAGDGSMPVTPMPRKHYGQASSEHSMATSSMSLNQHCGPRCGPDAEADSITAAGSDATTQPGRMQQMGLCDERVLDYLESMQREQRHLRVEVRELKELVALLVVQNQPSLPLMDRTRTTRC
eukprot:TRINITY_DN12606_c0_g1_i1.p1 TRINITY_DN12606_c0_g1~~TRINITY_DN12606_c0_g1_i1.p1  ORF type:complete len:500 (+),score=110.68 TRINITY_DN12606_c0_g1_i1:74-1573(+)